MRSTICIAAAALLFALAGCSEGPERAVVTGKVTFKGEPLSKGQIRFLIADRPSAMGTIEKGVYRIDHHGGVPVGSGKVEIEGFEETGKVIFTGPTGDKIHEARQMLPKKYNEKSELTVTIPPTRQHEQNFDLKP